MHFLKATILALSSAFAVNASRISSCTEPNTIALTFDDGPFDYTTDLLDELKAANIHATFFINGYNYWHDLETNPEKQAVLTRAVNEGHQIASHTWRHQIPVNETDIEPMMKRLDDVIEKATGYRPKYFRAPKGDIGADTVKFFEDLGYKVIQWDTDTNDWDFKTIGAEARVKLVKEFLTKEFAEKRESYLVLMHDVNDHTVHQIVPWIIENAPFDQYKFVTVAECLGDNEETHYDANGKFIPRENSIVAFNATEANAPAENVTREVDNSQNLQNTDAKSGVVSTNYVSGFIVSAVLLAYSLAMLI